MSVTACTYEFSSGQWMTSEQPYRQALFVGTMEVQGKAGMQVGALRCEGAHMREAFCTISVLCLHGSCKTFDMRLFLRPPA